MNEKQVKDAARRFRDWDEGYRNGRADKLLGVQLDTTRLNNSQRPDYADGYRAGQRDIKD